MFFSEDRFELEYVSALINEAYPGEPYWIGIDDRDGNGTWTTSLSQKHSKYSPIFADANAGSKSCGYVRPNSGGFASSSDCNLKFYYVCESQQLNEAPDNPCPNEYIAYKDKCLMPSPQRKTFDKATLFCATRGGIVLPIRDKGTFEFVRAWGPRAVRNDIWVGMRKKKFTRVHDNALTPPLQEAITDDLTYSDGGLFIIDTDYQLEATSLRGECFGLKSSEKNGIERLQMQPRNWIYLSMGESTMPG